MKSFIVGVLTVIFATVGHASGPLGGPCTYADTPGVATVISVEAADPGDLNCSNEPVEVVFDFRPLDSSRGELAASTVRLTISEGVNPPSEWVEQEGLVVGSRHACVRRDITSGTCTPWLFELTNVDVAAAIDVCYAEITFAMTVVPTEIQAVVRDQIIVLLVQIENYGFQPVSEPVAITSEAIGQFAEITIEPASIMPGDVCEITVVPRDRESSRRAGSGRGTRQGIEDFAVLVRGQRAGFEQVRTVQMPLWPMELVEEKEAFVLRDRFIDYLEEQHSELGIGSWMEWTGTIVKPHYLVVTHYLFFSDDWEMGLTWHNTIPPHDWAEMYLRHRYTHLEPQLAFRIPSRSVLPPLLPIPIEPPDEVDR